MSRSVTTVAETGGRCALVVFEKPWIHSPAEQTTIELMAMAAARAMEREVKRTSKVDSIEESSNGRNLNVDRRKEQRDEGEMASARAALGEEDGGVASSIALLAFLYGGQRTLLLRTGVNWT